MGLSSECTNATCVEGAGVGEREAPSSRSPLQTKVAAVPASAGQIPRKKIAECKQSNSVGGDIDTLRS